jgi:hypothetical protein
MSADRLFIVRTHNACCVLSLRRPSITRHSRRPERLCVALELRHRVGIDLVKAPIADWLIDDHSRLLERLEVLRHSRSADWQATGDLDDWLGSVSEPLEDGAPRWVA